MGKKNIVLVTGNGFDLDLGWKTSYQDFVNSNFWPFKQAEEHKNEKTQAKEGLNSLSRWLNAKVKDCNWIDLEALLKEYACKYGNLNNVDSDIQQFKTLKIHLGQYLTQAEKSEIKDSLATNLLWWLSDKFNNTTVYSFNYTDFGSILKRIGIDVPGVCNHVHGNLQNKSQIIGIDEDAKIREGYGFLFKSFQEDYPSTNLHSDLKNADIVIFYGLSFGQIDFAYFKSFFLDCINEDESKQSLLKKFLCFFTKDVNSECEIKTNLQGNGINISKLYSKRNVAFFYKNDVWSNSKIDEYFNFKMGLFLGIAN